MPEQATLQRVRFSYSVGYPLQYTGQLDMQSIWERIFRRAGLPIAYSQGFSPQPRLHLACALPLGFRSQTELLDVWLTKSLAIEEICNRVKGKTQPGMQVLAVREVSLSLPALQTTILSAEYIVEFPLESSPTPVQENLDQVLQAEHIIRERRGKTYDLRPLLIDMKLIDLPVSSTQGLWIHLRTQEGATGRPDEVLSSLGVDPFSVRITRIALHRTEES